MKFKPFFFFLIGEWDVIRLTSPTPVVVPTPGKPNTVKNTMRRGTCSSRGGAGRSARKRKNVRSTGVRSNQPATLSVRGQR